MAEVPVGCGKEPSLNLTCEPPPSFVPKIRFSLQPWGGGAGGGVQGRTAPPPGQLQHRTLHPPTPRWFSGQGKKGIL